MPYVFWTTTSSFIVWHNGICAAEGVPRPGRIQSNQSPAILNQWTDSWVDPILIQNAQNTFVVANVDSLHMAGLVAYSPQPVFNSNATVTVVYKRNSFTVPVQTVYVKKGKPPTYVMDGITYNTTTGRPVTSSTTVTTSIITAP